MVAGLRRPYLNRRALVQQLVALCPARSHTYIRCRLERGHGDEQEHVVGFGKKLGDGCVGRVVYCRVLEDNCAHLRYIIVSIAAWQCLASMS
jgi:hypothetical protein